MVIISGVSGVPTPHYQTWHLYDYTSKCDAVETEAPNASRLNFKGSVEYKLHTYFAWRKYDS